MSLPDFIILSKAVAGSQRQEIMRVVKRKGKYRFRQEFKWMHEMNQDQKKSHVLRVMPTDLDAKKISNVTNFDPTENTTSMISVCYS